MVKRSIHTNGSSKLYRIDINCEWNQENSHKTQDLLDINSVNFESDVFFFSLDNALKRHLFVLDETTLADYDLSKHEHLSDEEIDSPIRKSISYGEMFIRCMSFFFGRDESNTE